MKARLFYFCLLEAREDALLDLSIGPPTHRREHPQERKRFKSSGVRQCEAPQSHTVKREAREPRIQLHHL